MVELCILEPCRALAWASPACIIPKKDGQVCQITDLCSLNKAVICKRFPLSIIMDMLDHISQYIFYQTLHLHAIFHIWAQTKPWYCVTVMPFGKYKYKYKHLPWWDSNEPLTLPCKFWRKYHMMLTTPVSILRKLIHSLSLGNTIYYLLTKFYILLKPTASPSTYSNENGPSMTLTGLVTGSHPLAWNHNLKSVWIYIFFQKTFCNCMDSLVLSIIINVCGLRPHTFLHPSSSSLEWKHFVGHLI